MPRSLALKRRLMVTSRAERLAAKLARYSELSDPLQWWDDPVRWVADCVRFPDGGHLTPYQARELTALASDRRVAVRGPRGSGKTMPAALAFWWFACTRERAKADWKIPTTAGSWAQVSLYLWPEIRKWARLIDWSRVGLPAPAIGKELLTHHLRWNYGEGFGRATDDPNLIEGAHASNMLVIIDEGKSVTDGIWDAIEGFFANPGEHYTFALSTPGAAVGRFYDIHARAAGYEDWTPIHVTIEEAIEAGRITRSWQEQRLRQWGMDSVSYQCHVLAEFGGDEDGVIPLAWIDAAVERWQSRDTGACVPRVIAADITDTGTDVTVLAYVDGTTCYRLETFNEGDVLQHGERIAARTNANTRVIIDSIGVGAGTLARANELDLNASGFVASERTTRRDRTGTFGFINKRAAAWWNLRERLDPDMGDDIALPDDPTLIGDLTAPTWREAAGGKIQIESKADIKKRLGRSTDTGDAVVMALWDNKRVLTGELMV
jgi:hypothetical protein